LLASATRRWGGYLGGLGDENVYKAEAKALEIVLALLEELLDAGNHRRIVEGSRCGQDDMEGIDRLGVAVLDRHYLLEVVDLRGQVCLYLVDRLKDDQLAEANWGVLQLGIENTSLSDA
jgi:hypothetical protein